ncbi:MAG: GNAT family N-acetyltransferase [Caldilineaceae bacterium]
MIRTCTEVDIPAIVHLQQQWVLEQNVYGYAADTADELRARLNEHCLVAEDNARVIGFLLASVHVSPGMAVIAQGERYVEVDDLYVSVEMRQRGIGSQLLHEMERRARADGVERFLLYSAVKDLDAILHFYRNHGFQSWYVQMFK